MQWAARCNIAPIMPSCAHVDGELGDEGMHASCRVERRVSWKVG